MCNLGINIFSGSWCAKFFMYKAIKDIWRTVTKISRIELSVQTNPTFSGVKPS